MSRRSGFTLPEVMVAALILSLLSLTGIFLYQFAKRSQLKADVSAEAFRQGSHAVARLRRELRGAEVLAPLEDSSEELRYHYPELDGNGLLVVDAVGRPVWRGEARIFVQDGLLELEKPLGAEPRILARLEEGRFQVAADPKFFWFEVEVRRKGAPAAAFHRKFRLARDV